MVIGNICRILDEVYETGTNIFKGRSKHHSHKQHQNKAATMVSFLLVTKTVLGFRESARLVEIARETGCTIRLAAGKRSGSSESLYSFVHMGLGAGNSVVLNIEGEAREEAFHAVQKVLNGEGNE